MHVYLNGFQQVRSSSGFLSGIGDCVCHDRFGQVHEIWYFGHKKLVLLSVCCKIEH